MAQKNFSDGGGGGSSSSSTESDSTADAPEGAKRAVEETPDDQVTQDAVNDAFANLGGDSGGDSAPSGAQRAVDETPDEQVADDSGGDSNNDSGGSGGNSAPSGAQRAVDQTPEPDSGSGSSSNTTDTGARAAVERTPDEQADPNAAVEVRQQRQQEARRNRTLEDATPGETASSTQAQSAGGQQPSRRQSQSLSEQIGQTIGDVTQQAGETVDNAAGRQTQDLGDTPVTNPLTGNRVEKDLNQARDDFGQELSAFREFNSVVFEVGVTNRLYGTDSENDTAAESFGRDVTTRGLTGVATGTAGVLGAPLDTAAAAKEVAETGAFAVGGEGTLSERGERIAEQAGRFGGVTAQSAARRPVEFATGAIVETAIGGVAGSRFRAAGRSGARAARRAGDSGVSGVRSRTPSVDVSFNPDAPTLDVTPGALNAVRRTDRSSSPSTPDADLSRAQGAIQSSLANADLALQGAARRVGEVTRNPGRTADRALDRVVETVVTDPDTQTRTIDVRSRGDRIRSVAPETPDVDGGAVADQVTGTVQGGVLSAEAAITNARRRGRAGARRARDRVTPDSTPGDVGDQISGAVQGGILSAEAAVTNARRGARNRIPSRPERPSFSGDFPTRGDVQGAFQGGILSAEAALTNARRRASVPDFDLPEFRSSDRPRVRDLSVRVGPPRPSRQSQRVLDATGLDDVEADVRGDLGTPDDASAGGGGIGQSGGAEAFNIDGPDAGGQLDTTRTGTGTDQVVLEVGDTRTRSPDSGTQGPGFDLGSGLGSGLFDGATPSGDLADTSSGDLTDTGRGEGQQQPPGTQPELDIDIGPIDFPDFDIGQPEDIRQPPRQEERQPPRFDQRQPPDQDQRQPPRFDIDNPPSLDTDQPPEQRNPPRIDDPGTPRRPRADFDLDGGDGNRRRREELFGGDEQRYEFETRDIL